MTTPVPYDFATHASAGLLLGREREQALLREWLHTALDGRGRLALISGEAGIGKTALVTWLAAEARARGAGACIGRCDDLAQTPPYGPWQDALARSGGLTASLSLLSPSEISHASISSQSTLFDEFEAGLAAAAAAQPLVIVLEDLHCSDPTSLELLRALCRGIDRHPLLLVATYRGDELTPRQPLFAVLPLLAREPHTERIDLGPLAIGAVQALTRVHYALSPPDEARLVDYLQSRAGGNPFYLTELLRALESDRLLLATGTGWILGDLGRASLPPLIRQIVERRLAGIDEEMLRLLEVAAVIGQEARLDLWQQASGASHDCLLVAADLAAQNHLVLDMTVPTSLVFRHALVRDTLYSRQPSHQRRATHQRIAETLASRYDPPLSLVASHLASADDPRAIDWLVRAGEQALALYAPRDAIAALTRALDLSDRFSQTLPAAAYRCRAAAAALLGEFDRARRDYELALERARASGDLRAQWQTLLDLGMLWAERDYERTIGCYRAALTLAREMADNQAIAYSLNRIGNWYVNRDEPDAAVPLHQEALTLFRSSGDRAGIADTLDFLGMASYFDADLRHAAAYCEEAITLFREFDDRQRLSSCLVALAVSGGDLTWIAAPPYREPSYWIRIAEEALGVAREIGWPAGEAFAHVCLGMVLATRGDLGRALLEAELGLEIAQRIGHEQWTIAAQLTIATIWIELLDPDRALPLLEQALASARLSGSQFWTHTVVAVLTSMYVSLNEPTRATAVLGTVFLSGSGRRSLSQRQCQFAEAELRLLQGEAERALLLTDELITTRPHPTPDDAMPQLMKLRGDALWRLGRIAEADDAYRAASTSAALLEYRPLLWRVEKARGDLLSAEGRTAEAAEAFLRARSVIDEMASTIHDPSMRDTFRSRARTGLPLGGRSGPGTLVADQLSPRERDVLRHLVAGKSDREIATALFISPRTAMRHVASILGKLGVTSRTAAATIAVRDEMVSTKIASEAPEKT